MDKVSVVISTYKRNEELRKAIESVLLQTYKNIEIIVVDDNIEKVYSDMVQQIIRPYKQIVYVKNKKNLGGALSRNQGIKIAKGKYIAFLDDDDIYFPEKIQKQVECIESTKIDNVGVVYCHTVAVNEKEEVVYTYRNNIRGEFLYQNMLETVAATTQLLCLKSAVDRIGGFRDVPSKQDTTFLMDIAVAGYKIDVVPEVLTKYYELDIERISGVGIKNLKGELLLRDHMREYYSLLSEKQRKRVEYNVTFRIYYLQIRLGKYKEATQSLKLLYSNNINSKKTLLLLIKHPFREIFN